MPTEANETKNNEYYIKKKKQNTKTNFMYQRKSLLYLIYTLETVLNCRMDTTDLYHCYL